MTAAIVLIILTLVGRLQEIVSVLAYTKPVLVAMILGMAMLFLFFPYHEQGRQWRRPTLFWALSSIGFLLSVPDSLYRGGSITFLISSYPCVVIIFLLVSQCVRSRQAMETITFSLTIMALILALGILVKPNVTTTETSGTRYSVSTTYDSNDLAVVFVMSVPFLMYWFWRGGLFTKYLMIATLLLSCAGVYRTGSRGGLVTLGVVLLFMSIRVQELGLLLRSLILVSLLGGGVAFMGTGKYQELIAGVTGKDYNATDDDGRLSIWQRGIKYAITHPLNGVGIKCFENAEGLLSGRTGSVRWASAHNSYIQVLAENGFITFGLWLAMLLASYKDLGRQTLELSPWLDVPDAKRLAMLVGMTRTSLLAYMFGGFFLSLGYMSYMYLVVAMTVALSEITDQTVAECAEDEESEEEWTESDAESTTYAIR